MHHAMNMMRGTLSTRLCHCRGALIRQQDMSTKAGHTCFLQGSCIRSGRQAVHEIRDDGGDRLQEGRGQGLGVRLRHNGIGLLDVPVAGDVGRQHQARQVLRRRIRAKAVRRRVPLDKGGAQALPGILGLRRDSHESAHRHSIRCARACAAASAPQLSAETECPLERVATKHSLCSHALRKAAAVELTGSSLRERYSAT